MFLISRDEELTPLKLGTVLADFQTRELPKFRKRYNYYIGKQAILRKKPSDTGRPCNKVVANFCHTITENYLGYLAGIPISYEGKGVEAIQDVLKFNDVKTEDSQLLRNALIYGRAIELNYIDENADQRFKVLDTCECVPLYEDNLNNDLLYVIQFYKESHIGSMMTDEHYLVKVYSPVDVKTYRSNSGFTSFQLLDVAPHFFGQCPCSVFSLNEDENTIFEQVYSLQDAYNELLSGEIDNWDSFADAYLIMKGVVADGDDLDNAKRSRAFMIDNDADINYLTKDVSDTQVETMLANIKTQIHTVANSPDFTDKDFMAQSGVAIRYKLVGFENTASAIESRMRKALQRRVELISAITSLTEDEAVWRDVKITFTRNLPTDLTDTVTIVNSLRGLVSDETLLGLLPFIDDVKEEQQKLAKQNEERMSLYGAFRPVADEEEVVE